MLKPRISHVVFSSGLAPSESEYFDEINAYDKKALWLLLLFVSRAMIPIANGVQMTYYTIINDVEGICYIKELKNVNWTYEEMFTITKTYGSEFAEEVGRCEYLDYNYTLFANLSYEEALELKKVSGRKSVKDCYGGDILLTKHSSKYHTADTPFCYAKEIAKTMMVLKTGPNAFGELFFSILGDLFGRRKIALFVVGSWSLCSFLLSLVTSRHGVSYIFYAASCCLSSASDILTYVNLMEICHKKIRFFSVLTIYGYISGFLICTRFADHLLFSWRFLQYISFCFTLGALFHCWYVPESPRWLINKSKYKAALKVMKEIIGFVPNEILFEDEGSETPLSCQTVVNMFRFLWKRKIKILLILTTIHLIIGFIFETQVWMMMQSRYPLKATIVAASAELLSLPYTLIVYAAFGKKLGLFWTFITLNFTSFVSLCLQEEVYSHASAILIQNAVTAHMLNLSFLPDLFPTFLRCTALGIAACFASIARTITVQFIDWEDAGKNYAYLIFLLFSLPGFFILKLPDTTHAGLPTLRLFRV